ncbi:unnamed protein product [Gongylonema pulchrum]|uniref:Apple domain-containing protein n=1 Tax=Gongylonema pulchrum TaxID=637853 RepID=A0A183DYS1_9BILA|nr:unnamed protein product [Gongylonema pulchrum]
MYSTLAEPHGSGSLIENDDSIYAEKFCLPATRSSCQEDEIFILHVQKKIGNAAIDVKTANSITGCLQHCLELKRCKSAGFDSEHRRCYLYEISVGDSPNIVVPADAGWVLIESGCKNVRRKSAVRSYHQFDTDVIDSTEIQWAEWSLCQFKENGKMMRIRTRNCGDDCPDGGMQIEFC